ncbi:TolC family protein [Novosphingobium sp.]|uniref:TolC family protein n=1 Tax=Novosphingobium sp. TaxID=1874826 RepID=UPI001DE06FCC|nr:TolC family protein [Novosphingobium sp.]MBX9665051.1 TolC family protein [Novosphingobium sp.]
MSRRRAPALLALWLAAPLALAGSAQAATLDDALAAALAHAPEVAAADADADVAAARLDQARAEHMPTATLTGTVGYGRLDPGGYFGLNRADVTPRAAQMAIEQPLFTGGRVGAGIDRARAGMAAAEAGKIGMRSQLVVAVTQAYGDVLTASQLVDLYGRLVAETTEIGRQAELKFKAGESPSTDVAQASARLAEARAALVRAQGMQVSAQARFRDLTGLEPTDLQPLPANPALPATLDEAMDAAMAANPMLAGAEAGLRAAQAAARGARAERLPTVGAFAEAATVRDQFFPGYRGDSATVGIRARWQIFNGGRVSGKVAESDSAVRAADSRVRAARQQTEEQVIAAYQDVRTAQLVELAAGEQTAAAAKALESVRQEVRVGMKPQLDLLNAEREAATAAAGAARAGTDRIVAAYRLLALTGRKF